jgi:hypothetical protein
MIAILGRDFAALLAATPGATANRSIGSVHEATAIRHAMTAMRHRVAAMRHAGTPAVIALTHESANFHVVVIPAADGACRSPAAKS